MNILITGSKGFVGLNLTSTLRNLGHEVITFDRETNIKSLSHLLEKVDIVVHLAGSNRPLDKREFYSVNETLTEKLVNMIKETGRNIPIILSSSVQSGNGSDYGNSKLAAEKVILDYASSSNANVFIYRFPNLFGKWSKPNYNSVIATWCHNISRNMEINITDPNVVLQLSYIDDVVNEIVNAINGKGNKVEEHYYSVPKVYSKSLGEISDMLYNFKKSRDTLFIPDMSPGFESKLYSTYLSFLPKDNFSYPLVTHSDDRGSFTEFIKSKDRGQVSINVSKPGITKGEHWHHSKNEKFLVVKGEGLIQLRNIFSEEVIEYYVTDKKFEVVDIPTGYTHNIINNSNEDMVTVMWVNEPFDPEHPDTYFEKVIK